MDDEDEAPVPHVLTAERYNTAEDATYDSWMLLEKDVVEVEAEEAGEVLRIAGQHKLWGGAGALHGGDVGATLATGALHGWGSRPAAAAQCDGDWAMAAHAGVVTVRGCY
eukprot:3351897-Prymnesium_polylepis.1